MRRLFSSMAPNAIDLVMSGEPLNHTHANPIKLSDSGHSSSSASASDIVPITRQGKGSTAAHIVSVPKRLADVNVEVRVPAIGNAEEYPTLEYDTRIQHILEGYDRGGSKWYRVIKRDGKRATVCSLLTFISTYPELATCLLCGLIFTFRP